jgi:hypothetical protein
VFLGSQHLLFEEQHLLFEEQHLLFEEQHLLFEGLVFIEDIFHFDVRVLMEVLKNDILSKKMTFYFHTSAQYFERTLYKHVFNFMTRITQIHLLKKKGEKKILFFGFYFCFLKNVFHFPILFLIFYPFSGFQNIFVKKIEKRESNRKHVQLRIL